MSYPVCSGPVQTITTMSTKLTTENTTLTTYVPAAQTAAMVESICLPTQAISALGHLPGGVLATACSCIGHHLPTLTITSTVTAPAVRTQTTNFAGTAPTTTIYGIVLHTTTITERPTKYITSSTETCTTSTITVSYAAPTFTQVYGPRAGCIDATASGPGKALDASIRDLHKATQECKSLCAQDPSCSFVYTQRLVTKRGGTPHFQCSFNDQKLDAGDDLLCQKRPGLYGVAIGYDACERGTEPL